MLHPLRQRQYAARFKCQQLQRDPGSFIHVVTHSMLVVEHGALFHYHLHSQFTSCFSRELKWTGWSPNWCKDVFTFMKQRTSWSQGRLPAVVLALWAVCVHTSVFTALPQAAALTSVCEEGLKETKKKNSDMTSEDLVGKTFPMGKKLKVPLTRLLPLLVQNHDADFLFLAFVSGQFKVLLCDLAVIVAAVRVLRVRRLAVTWLIELHECYILRTRGQNYTTGERR